VVDSRFETERNNVFFFKKKKNNQKGLNQVTRIGEGFGSSMRVQGIVEMFRSAVKSSLTFFLETVQRDNIKAK
jgi:hypothetical protein